MVNDIISKKLYNLSKDDPDFFKKLNSLLTLQLFQRDSSIVNTTKCLTILKKTGDLNYLFYKCLVNKKIELLEQWKHFLNAMMQNTVENYDFFQEIQVLFSLPLEAICKQQEVINRILSKKNKKILYYFLQNDYMKAFQKIESFSEICINENPFIEFLIAFNLSNQGQFLDRLFKLLKKENNELAFLKIALHLLKMLHVFFSQDSPSGNLQNFAFSIDLLFWRLAKITLFFHNGALCLLIINYIQFAFERLFVTKKNFNDHSKNYLFLLCSFLEVFQRNFKSVQEKSIILEAKNKIIFIITKILQIIDQPLLFLKENFYLEIIFDDQNLKNLFIKAFSIEANKKPNNLESLLKLMCENQYFPEKLVLILFFLKSTLLKIYEDKDFFTMEQMKAVFTGLMRVSNAKDFKRLSLKERFTNNNLLHLEKTTLLLECFGIIGAFSQSNLPYIQSEEEICFDKNLSAFDLSKKIYV